MPAPLSQTVRPVFQTFDSAGVDAVQQLFPFHQVEHLDVSGLVIVRSACVSTTDLAKFAQRLSDHFVVRVCVPLQADLDGEFPDRPWVVHSIEERNGLEFVEFARPGDTFNFPEYKRSNSELPQTHGAPFIPGRLTHHIPEAGLDRFHRQYLAKYLQGYRVSMIERTDALFNFFMDLDGSQLASQHADGAHGLYKAMYDHVSSTINDAPIVTMRTTHDGSKIAGCHFHWPNLQITPDNAKHVIDRLKAGAPSSVPDTFFDSSVYRSGLRMLHSWKQRKESDTSFNEHYHIAQWDYADHQWVRRPGAAFTVADL
ncbi:uncharacterized protein BJ171DRAFT_603268 [Polychytrium aggregatum]|nr:uncharacterized protein BJ171DRAFT_603268 [Polychytrium aggregatum]KAI9193528.1 hypothetical protein BJ171DRAFT_603268 [Polychytrium aggregatum]